MAGRSDFPLSTYGTVTATGVGDGAGAGAPMEPLRRRRPAAAAAGSIAVNLGDPDAKPPRFPITDRNRRERRSKGNEFLWGAALGGAIVTSQIALYLIINTLSPKNFSDELDKANIFDKTSIDNLFLRTMLSYLSYAAVGSTLVGVLNIAWQAFKRTRNPSSVFVLGSDYKNKKEFDDVNKLWTHTIENDQITMSRKQIALGIGAWLLFLAPNYIYCYTFKDIGSDAVDLLPTPKLLGLFDIYGGPNGLNQNAGFLSFFMNTLLNQWFAKAVVGLLLSTKNSLSLTRKNFTTEGYASKELVGFSSLTTLVISAISSASFFFLALDDKDRETNYSPLIATLIPWCALAVYGCALNLEGGISIKKQVSNFAQWLQTMPKPALDAHKSLKEYRGYIAGWLAHNVREYFLEMSYYLGNSSYVERQEFDLDLAQPAQAGARNALLAPTADSIQDGERDVAATYTHAEVQAGVNARIAIYKGRANGFENALLKRFIQETIAELKAKSKPEASKATVWEHGRVRQSLGSLALNGPLGLSIVLMGYYLLITNKLTERVYNGWLDLGLKSTDVISRLLSLYLFSPFIKLVLDSGFSAMKGLLLGTEHKIQEVYHSLQVLTGRKQNTDFLYEDRFHPTTAKEIIRFAFSTVMFFAKITAFVVTPPTSATVIDLLDENNFLTEETSSLAFWYTAIFNSFGAASLLGWAEGQVIKRYFSDGKGTLMNKSDAFFKGLSAPNCRFDLEQLDKEEVQARDFGAARF